jgi:hypothetical protein
MLAFSLLQYAADDTSPLGSTTGVLIIAAVIVLVVASMWRVFERAGNRAGRRSSRSTIL